MRAFIRRIILALLRAIESSASSPQPSPIEETTEVSDTQIEEDEWGTLTTLYSRTLMALLAISERLPEEDEVLQEFVRLSREGYEALALAQLSAEDVTVGEDLQRKLQDNASAMRDIVKSCGWGFARTDE